MSGLAAWLHATAFSQTIQSVGWIIPLLQSIHILMIGIVFVSSLMIALRVLGRVRADESFEAVSQRFGPWVRIALGVMLATGVLLVVGEPAREFGATSFWLKMALLVLAVVVTRLIDRAPDGPAARPAAIGLILLWLAIIFLGRAIAYDTEVWQSLHA
jgi:putative copper export protein